MNDMRRLMNLMEDSGVRYDPLPGDDEPLNRESFMAGDVKVTMSNGEVTLSHGHGENIFLSDDEWSLFINGINNEG